VTPDIGCRHGADASGLDERGKRGFPYPNMTADLHKLDSPLSNQTARESLSCAE